ncbi:general stress protein [Roseateles saccharophilus]|uniref:General stress protein 17M-like domain-containing protein n=1 Tax=Roseateles saccharophilus TaxID=304 RepID=A0A4R3UVK7_ROSSA|nr:DUF1269 domain-containing protein [Roseateles saccharophilus]MDG0833180.1 DUF1269 domain-containing protein [Roseateles saccharophilus]TCU94648.1 hypothetical protein EV671_101670 [Roseateles saccharophilus]
MQHKTEQSNAVVAVFKRHQDAEDAIRKLAGDGFDMTQFSIVGQGFHSEEKVVGFYNTGDRIKFWGKNGAFWGGLWSLFFGGIFLTIPVIGPVMVLGHLAAMVVAAVEGAVLVGGLSALGAALYSIGIPKDSVIQYEEAVKTDGFLVIGHGSTDEMAKARAVLEASNPKRIDLHEDIKAPASDDRQSAAMTGGAPACH